MKTIEQLRAEFKAADIAAVSARKASDAAQEARAAAARALEEAELVAAAESIVAEAEARGAVVVRGPWRHWGGLFAAVWLERGESELTCYSGRYNRVEPCGLPHPDALRALEDKGLWGKSRGGRQWHRPTCRVLHADYARWSAEAPPEDKVAKCCRKEEA